MVYKDFMNQYIYTICFLFLLHFSASATATGLGQTLLNNSTSGEISNSTSSSPLGPPITSSKAKSWVNPVCSGSDQDMQDFIKKVSVIVGIYQKEKINLKEPKKIKSFTSQINAISSCSVVRFIVPDMAYTLEYRFYRVNIELDDTGIISKVTYG